MQPTSKQRLWMYETMVKSRYNEARLSATYMEGKSPLFNMANGPLPGEMHLSDGQEPYAVGLGAHLTKDDYFACHHRSHAQALAKGVDLKRMTAEILGRKAGLSEGRAGHIHIFDYEVLFWSSGIIGQNMGPAVGAALARKMRGEAGIAIACIGEGGANQGGFHEAMNLAAVWKLPFICVIEDNQWAVSVPKAKSTAIASNADRAAAYGMPGERVASNDPDDIFAAVGRAVARARAGEGPSLLELQTVRLQGHFMGDPEVYRPKAEIAAKPEMDPIPHYRRKLIAAGVMTEIEAESIVARAHAEVDEAFAFARSAAEPVPEDAFDKVFV